MGEGRTQMLLENVYSSIHLQPAFGGFAWSADHQKGSRKPFQDLADHHLHELDHVSFQFFSDIIVTRFY